MVTLASVVLGVLLLTVALGAVNLLRWVRGRRSSVPTAKVATHIALVLAATAGWIAFMATRAGWLAWIAFAAITLGQVFGDLLMFASYRARSGETGKVGYFAVAAELFRSRRPVAALHAIVAAVGYFTMLVTAVWASIA